MSDRHISVVIPVYNLSDYLRECVMSVLNQTVLPLEILIVENASTDDSLAVANQMQKEYPDLIQVISEPRPGAPIARNTGLAAATGAWIQFLDGDDLLLPTKLESQIQGPGDTEHLICGPAMLQDVDGHESVISLSSTAWEGLFYGGGKLGFTSSNLWSRSALQAVGGWNEDLQSSQEYELMFRMLVHGYTAKLGSEVLTIKRDRVGQISKTPYAPRLYNYLKLRHRIYMYLHENQRTTPDTRLAFLRHYMSRYTKLRKLGPRLAIRIRKEQFKQLRRLPEFQQIPDRRWLMMRSHISTLTQRVLDLVKLRWKKYFIQPDGSVLNLWK